MKLIRGQRRRRRIAQQEAYEARLRNEAIAADINRRAKKQRAITADYAAARQARESGALNAPAAKVHHNPKKRNAPGSVRFGGTATSRQGGGSLGTYWAAR